ncbi:mRNA-decapping enzyme 1B isoform X2 [Erinaceus europaeus]|uniref:mRNA-decapping enzyme 1B isoform X2 n=1 Tax=Erinaceus europaeus TaxID=9365 RepID=A0ABM3XF77_ERIEU|nr:mRNA-decapping enzyme 1B isoform X2 [Erinaceus europaeus]
MKNLTQYEQLKAHQGAEAGVCPMTLTSGEGKEVDILRMLTKAKDEYTKCKTCSEPKQMTSLSAIHDNPNLIKPIPVKPRDSQQVHDPQVHQLLPVQGPQLPMAMAILDSYKTSPQSRAKGGRGAVQECVKTFDPEHQHLALTALFGRQDRARCQQMVEQPQVVPQHRHWHQKLSSRPGVVRSLSYEEPGIHSPPTEKPLCPAIQKLLVGSADLQLQPGLPESQPSGPGSAHPAGAAHSGPAQPGCSRGHGTACQARTVPRTRNLLERLPGVPGPASPCGLGAVGLAGSTAPSAGTALQAAQPQRILNKDGLPPPTEGHQLPGREQCPLSASGAQSCSSGMVSPQELLTKLQRVQQQQHAAPRPALAARFPALPQDARATTKMPGTGSQMPLFQVISPQHVLAPAAPSLLMTPLVFARPTIIPPQERDGGLLPPGNLEPAAAGLVLPLQKPKAPLAGSPLSKMQLQEALLHLIRNDDSFLNRIYEAYLFSMTQAAPKKTL